MNKKQMNTTKVFRFKRFARKSYSVFNSLHKAVTIGVLAGTALISAHAASVNPVETTYKTTLSDSIPQEELE
ncbi:MAG TPA: TonB-dependent receptor, partial [Porphyromonadaceae bacterium]|nr:TonB-dependent receptor [Porphyromonadaceae bacterium]